MQRYQDGLPPRDDKERSLYQEWADLDADHRQSAEEAMAEDDWEQRNQGPAFSDKEWLSLCARHDALDSER